MDLIQVILSFIKCTIILKNPTLFILGKKFAKWIQYNIFIYMYWLCYKNSGLIWSFKILEKTLLSILITRLATGKMKNDLPGCVVVVNSHELITIVYSVIVTAYVTDVYRGLLKRFVIVVFSTTVSIVSIVIIKLIDLFVFLSFVTLIIHGFFMSTI